MLLPKRLLLVSYQYCFQRKSNDDRWSKRGLLVSLCFVANSEYSIMHWLTILFHHIWWLSILQNKSPQHTMASDTHWLDFSFPSNGPSAKAATEQFYKPLLLVTNLIYLFFLLRRSTIIDGTFEGLCIIATYALQIYSYFGILEQAAATSGTKSKELTGGQHLDWLALSLVVQFGSVFHSKGWFWLLLLFPIVTLYSLYSTVRGVSGGGSSANANYKEEASDEKDQGNSRREKRAEKRRKKWS